MAGVWSLCLPGAALAFFQIYQFSEEKSRKRGEGRGLKAGATITRGLKIVLLSHLIKMCHHVHRIEFNKIYKAITPSNPNGRRKIQIKSKPRFSILSYVYSQALFDSRSLFLF